MATSTYLSNFAIRTEINHSADTYESHVYGIVNAILTSQFPVQQGYITRPQNRAELAGGGHGFSDFHTFQYVNGVPRCFLITQCKARGNEETAQAWHDAEIQLRDYLATEHGTRPPGQRPSAYGMVVNGRGVRFFRYRDDGMTTKRLSPAALDDHWDPVSHHALIQQRLNNIRSDH